MNSSTPDAKSVFGRAAEIPSPTARAAFLDDACAGHPAVRAEVETLLKALGNAGAFMASPAVPDRTADYDEPITEREGTVIGPYTLREQIGEGGMGLVFVAEQQHPVRRKVALKVIKPGMDTRQVVARFEAERQALALMDHPHIAKVLDAGTTASGLPYFVMELVKGVPITEYADANNLTPKDRLGLFVQVCQAVQHAHQKGVIHRDLKPSNILVAPHDGIPVVKVIDFGVAKALGQSLTEKTIYTRFAQMIGTPLYMSPEQAEVNQLDADTRSDVYSLGVLLYELLTGTTPFDGERFRKAAFDEIRRIIKEEEPPRPSTRLTSLGATLTAVSAKRSTDPHRLAGLVRGELDWIAMRCLEKDRTRRYDSAASLAKDVQRYLSGDAVEACPPTLGYRLKKAYRRNRAAVLVGGSFAAVLLAATGVSLAFGIHADRSRRLAEVAERQADADRDVAVKAQAEATKNAELALTEAEKVKVEQNRIRRLHYASQMTTATNALATNQLARLQLALDDTRPKPGEPDLRGWEWHYLDRLTRTDRVIPLEPDKPPGDQKARRIIDSFLSRPRSHDGRWLGVNWRQDGGIVVDVHDAASGRRTGQIPKSGTLALPSATTVNVDRVRPLLEQVLPLLSDDGKHLLFLDAPSGRKSDIPRLWDVSRGEPVPDCTTPPIIGPNVALRSVVLGPDAAWIAWIEQRTTATAVVKGPRDITVSRWSRATGATSQTHLRVGDGNGFASLSPDARTVFWIPNTLVGPPYTAEPGPDDKGVFECWTVESKARRWSVPVPGRGRGMTNNQRNIKLSTGATMVLIVGPKEAAVYRTSDGALQWKTDLPSDMPENGSSLQYLLSDDGNRIVLKWLYNLAVVENRPGGSPVTRRFLFREPLAEPAVIAARSGISPLLPYLLPDGRTVVGLAGSSRTLRMWDVSRDPEVASLSAIAAVQTRNSISHGAQRFTSDFRQLGGETSSLDGKRIAKATLVPQNPKLATNSRVADPDRYSGPVIVSESGREIARVEVSKNRQLSGLQFLESGLLFMTLTASQQGSDQGIGIEWAVYDPAAGGKLVPVAQAQGQCEPIPGSPYLLTSDEVFDNARFQTGVSGYRIVHAATGKEVFTRTVTGRDEFMIGVNSFHSASGRFVELRRVVNAKWEATGLRVQVCEIATGKELWGKDLEPVPPLKNATFTVATSPDGQRFIVTYASNLLPGGINSHESEVQLWFARLADGSDLRAVRATLHSGVAVRSTQFTSRGLSADGREVVLARSSEVQTWNLETGELTHRLERHPNAVTDVLFSNDRTRIFTVTRVNPGLSERLHVWDTATDREVFTLPLGSQSQGPSPTVSLVGLNGAKLVTRSGSEVRVLDGTPQPEPTK